jgi:hypothetical protein
MVQERRSVYAGSKSKRELESLLALGSAIAWGALAVSLWGYLERSRTRRVRHQVSNRLLQQVFPTGRMD